MGFKRRLTVIPPPDDRLASILGEFANGDENAKPLFKVAQDLEPRPANDPQVAPFLASSNSAIFSAQLITNCFSITYNACRYSLNGDSLEFHPFYGAFSFTHDQGSLEEALRAFEKLLQTLRANALIPTSISDKLDIEPQKAVLEAVNSSAIASVERMNQFHRDWAIQIDELRNRLYSELDDKRTELESDFAKKNNAFDQEIAAKRNALQKQEDAVEEKKKQLDDRDYMHVRRDVFSKIIARVQDLKNFKLSVDTFLTRFPVHALFLVLLVSLASGIIWTLYSWGVERHDTWSPATIIIAVKTITFTAGFVTIASIYANWMMRWFDQRATTQLDIVQFETDISRAAWAVEAAMEWQKLRNEEMPEALVTSLTRGLFDRPGSVSNEAGSSLDALASTILGSAAHLKLKVGGNEIDVERKGLANLKKTERPKDGE